MGTKNVKGSVSIELNDNRIRLRWRHQTKRYSLQLFSNSKSNHLRAKQIALTIEQDLINSVFDTSLVKYKPSVVPSQKQQEEVTLIEHFEQWVRNYRNMDCEKDVDYNSTRNMMLRWGSSDVSTVLKNFNSEKIAPRTYNRRLTLLNSFFKWALKAKVITENPLEDVIPRKAKRTEKENRKPFTETEIRLILDAIKNDTFCSPSSGHKHSYYYPFLFFMFKMGVRNAEAVGLRVKHVNVPAKTIVISESLARSLKGTNAAARVRKDTKNGKHRTLPLTDDLLVVIEPLLRNKNPDDLVFQSPSGIAIDDRMFQKRVFSKVLKKLDIPHRVLYACRHTFNSRCIEAGMSPVMAAFLMGNNPETALRNYTHQMSTPDNLPNI